MNQMLGVQGQSPPRNRQSNYSSLPDILNLLRLSRSDTSLTSEFSQAFELCEFQLGDQLVKYDLPYSLRNSVHYEQVEPSQGWFYIVCQGRVRLLGLDAVQSREVPALVVEAGESFGTEALFWTNSELRSAIAASSGLVARIPITDLQVWLERLPTLRDYLQQQAIERQCLIFFKTSTQLRSLPSHQLRQLLPYLVEKRIEAGSSLAESTPSDAGRFWLRSGEISKGELPTPAESEFQPQAIKQSWGYPNPTPVDWIAQTDLVLYQLPTEHWEAALVIAPVLATASGDTASSNGNPKPSLRSRPQPQLLPRAVNRPLQPDVEASPGNSPLNSSQSEPNFIAFPKPVRRMRLFGQRTPFIQQQSTADCGAACLAMIGLYWGKRFSLNSLRNLAGVGRAGASLKGLATAAETLGFRASPVRASLSRLIDQPNPWIAHWQGDHYVVVYRRKGARILIADPTVGRRSLTTGDFHSSWTGYALLLDPTQQLQALPTEKNSLGRFWGVLWPYRTLIGQIIFASLLMQVFGLITPLFTQIILDRVVVHKSLITLHVFALGLVLFGVWRIGLSGIRQYLLDYLANRLDLTLISGFISHTLTLPLTFFESRHVGDIITRVQENQKIQRFLTRQAVTAWLDASMAVVYLGLMAYYNWHLTLLVLALIPPIVILTVVASPFLRGVSREIFNEEAGQNSSLVEMMNGVATVKAAAAERELRWRWEDRLTSTLNARFRGQKLGNGLQVTGGLINTLGSTALLWYGATLVIQDQLTIGQFVAFNMLIGNVINPVLALVNLWDELQEVMVSVERLNDVFCAVPEESPQKPMLALPQLRGEVLFENVTFRYTTEQERNTLQNISFGVKAGQTIAIVGRSGSGKSTLVSLLQGLYHPTSGRICVDGHDIRHASPQSFRSQLGKEGQSVKAGEELVELDTEIAATEVDRLQQMLVADQIQLNQMQSLIEKTRLEAHTRTEIANANTQSAAAALAQTKAKVQAAMALIAQNKANAATKEQMVTQLQTDAAASQARLERLKPLLEQGAIAKEQVFDGEQSLRDRQRNITQSQGELQQTQGDLARLQAELQQALAESEQLQAGLTQKQAEGRSSQIEVQQKIQQLEVEKTQLKAKIAENQNLLVAAKAKLKQRFLYAPVDGVVSSFNIANIGEVVQPGQTIAEIAPQNAPLVLSASLPNQEAGFVKTGMPVQVKLDAYPYQDYGVVTGKVVSISPDAKPDERLGAVYRVEVALQRNYVSANHQTIRFKAGETAAADIIIRRRRIADILLDPIRQLQKGGVDL